jgi:DNA-binding GntR family transcriptional regulator
MQKREALRSGVYAEIHAEIVSGDIAPECRLRDTDLASELGVSRTPVREALLRLEREGLVQNLVGRGFRVTPLSIEDARDVYTILWTLESLALRLSPPLPKVVRRSLDMLAVEIEKCPDPARCVELDNRWHDALIARCGNPRLLSLIAEAKGSIRRYELRYMRLRDLVSASARDHHRIAAAAVRDPEAAAKILENHWRTALDALAEKMEKP